MLQPIGRFHVGPSWTLHEVGRPHRPPCRAAAGGDRRLFWLMALGPRAVSLYCRSWKSGASPHWIFRFSRVRPRVAGPVWGRLIAHLKHTALVDRVRKRLRTRAGQTSEVSSADLACYRGEQHPHTKSAPKMYSTDSEKQLRNTGNSKPSACDVRCLQANRKPP